MDWLGGLSNIKGQITNITKDLLAESTAEFSDPEAELRSAKSYITELELTVESQKRDLQALTDKNQELEVRLETAQLRFDHAREQFENQLQEKEMLIEKLRAASTWHRSESDDEQSFASRTQNYPRSCAPDLISGELASEEFLSGSNKSGADVSASWEELRVEVQQLRASVIKWRKIAKQKMEPSAGDSHSRIFELEQEIENLRRRLAESEDTREMEVVHIRQTYEERLEQLRNRLHDADTALESMKVPLANLAKQTASPQIEVEPSLGKSTTKGKSSRGKKKRGKLAAQATPVMEAVSEPGQSVDFGVQTDVISQIECSVETEPLICTTLVDTPHVAEFQPTVVSASVQVDEDLMQTGVSPNLLIHQVSSAVPAPSERISPVCSAAGSDPSIVVVGSDDHHSQPSDASDASSCAHMLDELIHQLAEEIESNEHELDEFTRRINLAEDIASSDMLTEFSRKLAAFHTNLQSRRQKLDGLLSNQRKPRSRYRTGSPESLHVTTPVCPASNLLQPESERDAGDWREDAFTELDFRLPLSTSESIHSRGDEKNTQTTLDLDVSNTLVNDLQEKIRDLQSRLDLETTNYEARLANLEPILTSQDHIKSLLEAEIQWLSEHLPDSITTKLSSDFDWPPADPEAQLLCVFKAISLLDNHLQATVSSLQELQSTVESVNSEHDVVQLARQLCVALDPDFIESNWDPDQWDALLYDLLKPRFSDSSLEEGQEPAEQSVIRLTAEIAALRDILAQHTVFRDQAEHDLRELLSTVSMQQEKIDILERENSTLKETPVPMISASSQCYDTARESSVNLDELVREHCISVGLFDQTHPSLLQLTNEELRLVFDRLSTTWSGLREQLMRADGALQQKHAESQNYFSELQRVYSEWVTSEQCNKELKSEVDKLKTELAILQESVTKQSVSPVGTSQLPSDSSTDDGTECKLSEPALVAEITRLRSHLIEMEESYTTEALNAEAREVELRDQLKCAQNRLQQLEEMDGSFEQRLAHAESERDEARSTAEGAKREVDALRASLANLQSVLNSFQQNQQSSIDTETEHIRLEMRKLKDKELTALAELEKLKTQLKDQGVLEQHASQLERKIALHDSQISMLKTQVDQRDSQIDALRTRLAQMAVDTDSKIDKMLMKNLLLSFLQLPTSQRANGLHVIGNLLQFTEEEYKKVESASGGLPTLFGWIRNAASVLPSGPPKDMTLSSTYPDKSFTDLLLSFLEQESKPGTSLRLPTEYYTPDVVRSNTVPGKQSIVPEEVTNPSDVANITPPGVNWPELKMTSPPTTSESKGSSPLAKNPLFTL